MTQKNLVILLLLSVTFWLIADMSYSFAVSDKENPWNIYKLSGNFITPDNKGFSHQIFSIPYQILGGELAKIQVDQEAMSFLVTIKGDMDGEINLVIPRNLLDVKSTDGKDGKFFVLVDGIEEANYGEIKNQCYRSLLIPFHKGSQTIEIIGDNTNLSVPKKSEVQPLYMETNKDHYSSGETVIVEGCTSLNLEEGDVTVDVLDPNGKVYQNILVTPNIDGTFSSSFIIDNKPVMDEHYTVKANYGKYTTIKTFTVPEFPIVTLVLLAAIIPAILFSRKVSN